MIPFIFLYFCFVITTVLDYLWKEGKEREICFRGKSWNVTKQRLAWTLLIVGTIPLVFQIYESIQTKRDTEFLKENLTKANESSAKNAKLAERLDAELQRFRNQSDHDTTELFSSLMNTLIPSKDERAFAKGNFSLMTGREENAKEYFKMAVRLNPKHSSAQNNLGLIYKKNNDTNRANECFRYAFQADNNNAAAAGNYAATLYGQPSLVADVLSKPTDLSGIPPKALLEGARFLDALNNTNFLKYLDGYIRFADKPSYQDIENVLAHGWTNLTSQQKQTIENWEQNFTDEVEKKQFQETIQKLKSR